MDDDLQQRNALLRHPGGFEALHHRADQRAAYVHGVHVDLAAFIRLQWACSSKSQDFARTAMTFATSIELQVMRKLRMS